MFPFYLQAFVDYFSRGLHAEYKSKGIIVQVSSLFHVSVVATATFVSWQQKGISIFLFMSVWQIKDKDFLWSH